MADEPTSTGTTTLDATPGLDDATPLPAPTDDPESSVASGSPDSATAADTAVAQTMAADSRVADTTMADTPSEPETADKPPARRRRRAAAPAGEPALAEARSGTGPVNPAPADPAPTDIAPVDQAPTDIAPADQAPADTAPTDIAPADQAPADTAPTDIAPADQTPADTAPTDQAPADPAPAVLASSELGSDAAAPVGPTAGTDTDIGTGRGTADPQDRDEQLRPFASMLFQTPDPTAVFQAPEPGPPRRRRATSAAGPAQPAMFSPPAPDPEPAPSGPAGGRPTRRRNAAAVATQTRAGVSVVDPTLVEGLLDDLDDLDLDDDTIAPPAAAADAALAGTDLTRALEDEEDDEDAVADAAAEDTDEDDEGGARPRRRRRGGRGRKRRRADGEETVDEDETAESGDDTEESDEEDAEESEDSDDGDDSGASRSARRRRRRRRRTGGDEDLAPAPDDPPGTVVKVRDARSVAEDVTSVRGSTRLEAKRQRRREGRDTMRRRTIITEAEFLARRESVDRTLLVRDTDQRTQIAVLEDGVLVEHYVTRAAHQSMIGNVHLGKVQNVLPSMEAAFVDIGRGRNAVLYAGEVNWDSFGLDGKADRRIEAALKPGDTVLVQVTKDPVGHKGARLTSQISLPGRFLVYVPGSSMTGISRKLPDTERSRLKRVLKRVVPEGSGVIVRTAAEGAAEEDLERDVARLTAQWADIERKATSVSAPALLYSEPDLAIRVVRDAFNEDFTSLVVSGDDLWDTLSAYVGHVAPDLASRMSRWQPEPGEQSDLFVAHRLDEQIAKGLDRKVWLPSGGSLIIDRTEAMTVVDVNTGKYTGSGGDLEETVTRNNLEAAEEIVRQLRLRDIGGIIVIDFIDMVLESNRQLVLRRLVECLGRDRTKHQVAEVTSLGLVQMTRKRVGQGLLEAFSTTCETCHGRGLIVGDHPVDSGGDADMDHREPREHRGGDRGEGRGDGGEQPRYRRGRRVDQPA